MSIFSHTFAAQIRNVFVPNLILLLLIFYSPKIIFGFILYNCGLRYSIKLIHKLHATLTNGNN